MILEENVSKSAQVISGYFVIIIKNVETEKPTFKARFETHGNKDSEENQLMQNSTIAR